MDTSERTAELVGIRSVDALDIIEPHRGRTCNQLAWLSLPAGDRPSPLKGQSAGLVAAVNRLGQLENTTSSPDIRRRVLHSQIHVKPPVPQVGG